MVRSQDQSGFQLGIEGPEEELDALSIQGSSVHRLAWLQHTGKRCAKAVAIVCFKAPPDADVVGEVLGKLDHNMCEGLALSAGEMERVIGQRTLGFGEEPAQVLGNFRQGAFTASKPSLGSMGTRIHKGISPLATCHNMHGRTLSMCQRHVASLRLFRRWICRNRACLMASRFSGCARSSARSSKRSCTSPRSSKSGRAKAWR